MSLTQTRGAVLRGQLWSGYDPVGAAGLTALTQRLFPSFGLFFRHCFYAVYFILKTRFCQSLFEIFMRPAELFVIAFIRIAKLIRTFSQPYYPSAADIKRLTVDPRDHCHDIVLFSFRVFNE